MQSRCSTGLVSIFLDSSLLQQQFPLNSKSMLAAANKSLPTETKICRCGKVKGEGGRLVHTAISMIYWPMGNFLRASGIPFCSRTSVTVHQTDKSEMFCCPIIIPSHRYAADGEGRGGKTV